MTTNNLYYTNSLYLEVSITPGFGEIVGICNELRNRNLKELIFEQSFLLHFSSPLGGGFGRGINNA